MPDPALAAIAGPVRLHMLDQLLAVRQHHGTERTFGTRLTLVHVSGQRTFVLELNAAPFAHQSLLDSDTE